MGRAPAEPATVELRLLATPDDETEWVRCFSLAGSQPRHKRKRRRGSGHERHPNQKGMVGHCWEAVMVRGGNAR